jgi:hypothetical protein
MEQIGFALIGWSLVAFVTRTWQEGLGTILAGAILIGIASSRKRVF